jgi:siroheme synthase-like protein
VTVVAPTVTERLAEQHAAGAIRWVQDSFRPEHARGTLLVVAATDDDECNAAVVRAAVENRALACDASSGERSQVIFGALLEDDEVSIAVFTGGRDPSLARRTRDTIADLLGRERKREREP